MKTKYLYFEGIRGVLAIIVIIHHFVLLFFPKLFICSYNIADYRNHPYSLDMLVANSPLSIFMNGSWAVCMFFTLSGFVLSQKYLTTNNTLVLKESIGKRYFRLAIPILGACLLVFLLHLLGAFKNLNYPRNIEEFSFGKNLFVNNLSIIETLKMALFNVPVNGDNTYLPILWTMEVEFLGALLLFVFLLAIHELKNKWVFYLIILSVLFAMNKNYILLFFAGSFIAQYEELIKDKLKNNFIKIFLLLLALYFSGIPNIQNEAKQYTIYSFTTWFSSYIYIKFHIISCMLFFVLIVSTQWPKKIFVFKPLLFFGKISFAMYLLHLPILFVVGTYFLNASNGHINLLFLFVICFCITAVISFLFYYFIDAKAVLFANKLVKKIIKPI
ncbi:MAG: acyltransferase [Bacteroidia bacterium]